MFSTRIRALIHQQWAGLIALFLVLTGGTALATHPGGENTISTADIQDGQVKVADVGEAAVASHELKNDSILPDDVAPDSLGSGRIATGAVRTEEVANGQVQAEDLAPGVAPGASGARAWGLVNSTGTLLREKNVTDVGKPDEGIYCIDPGSGIDPTTAVMVVGVDFRLGTTSDLHDDVVHVEWDSNAGDCPAGTMEVRTFIGLARPPSFGEIDSGGFDLVRLNESFTFVIP